MRSKNAELKKQIYHQINDCKRREGRDPSLKEIGDSLGINKSTVYRYLVEMDRDGMISYSGNRISTKEVNRINTALSPAMIVGNIPCGEAQSEEEYVEEYVNLPESLFGKGEFYLLRAKGDSMIDAGIEENDLVVILKQSTAVPGDIVVALDEENQNTLKSFSGFDGSGNAVLAYRNEKKYPGKTIRVKQLAVQGVAKHIIKSL